MTWEYSKFRGVQKWVSWSAGCWVTFRKKEPSIVHVGFDKTYQGTWELTPKAAREKLETMWAQLLMNQ
jgi:hypothetical protein